MRGEDVFVLAADGLATRFGPLALDLAAEALFREAEAAPAPELDAANLLCEPDRLGPAGLDDEDDKVLARFAACCAASCCR